MPTQKGIINSDLKDNEVPDIDDIESEELLDYEENRIGKLILTTRSFLYTQVKRVKIELYFKFY